MKARTERKSLNESLRSLLPYTQLGWQLLATMLVFFGIGYGLDAWLELSPTLTVTFSVIGVVVAVVQFVKLASKIMQEK